MYILTKNSKNKFKNIYSSYLIILYNKYRTTSCKEAVKKTPITAIVLHRKYCS